MNLRQRLRAQAKPPHGPTGAASPSAGAGRRPSPAGGRAADGPPMLPSFRTARLYAESRARPDWLASGAAGPPSCAGSWRPSTTLPLRGLRGCWSEVDRPVPRPCSRMLWRRWPGPKAAPRWRGSLRLCRGRPRGPDRPAVERLALAFTQTAAWAASAAPLNSWNVTAIAVIL